MNRRSGAGPENKFSPDAPHNPASENRRSRAHQRRAHRRHLGIFQRRSRRSRRPRYILHANPHHHFVGVFVDLVYRVSDVRLWKIAVVATVYVILRFIEAYGLWYIRPWAEWLTIASGSIYIPFEVGDLLRKPDWIRLLILAINLGIVLYMLMLRLEAAKKRRAERH